MSLCYDTRGKVGRIVWSWAGDDFSSKHCRDFCSLASIQLIFAFSRAVILVTKSLQRILGIVQKQRWWNRSRNKWPTSYRWLARTMALYSLTFVSPHAFVQYVKYTARFCLFIVNLSSLVTEGLCLQFSFNNGCMGEGLLFFLQYRLMK